MEKLIELSVQEMRQIVKEVRKKANPRIRDYDFVDELGGDEIRDLYQLFTE